MSQCLKILASAAVLTSTLSPTPALAANSHYDYWVMTNTYKPNKVDFYGYIQWKAGTKRFCYQEWTFVHSRKGQWVRQRAFTAKRVAGRDYYLGHDFSTPRSNPQRVWMKPASYGHRMTIKFLDEGLSLTGMKLLAVSRARFLQLNGGNGPSWTPCPRF